MKQAMLSRVELLRAEVHAAEGQYSGNEHVLQAIKSEAEAYRNNLDNE